MQTELDKPSGFSDKCDICHQLRESPSLVTATEEEEIWHEMFVRSDGGRGIDFNAGGALGFA